MSRAILLVTCPDRPGLVADVANVLFDLGANIVHADQHTDTEHELFLQRVEFDLAPDHDLGDVVRAFTPVAERAGMMWSLHDSAERQRTAILVSRQGHCLYDLLARWAMGELPADLAMIVSNHPDHAEAATRFGLPFHHLPTTPDNRAEQQRRMHAILTHAGVELVVLARYMQILEPGFVAQWPRRIINIHHSFLPAFVGARPYHQALARGVKLIGATSHYVTADLDAGPIIEQDVVRVSHRDDVDGLIAKGRDLETVVLARALNRHLERRVLPYANRTVVFD